MTQCPHCQKRLLSQASARCNWCGALIDDPAYQAQAQQERDAFFAHAAAHDAQSLANVEAINVLGAAIDPFTNGPILTSSRMPRPIIIVPPAEGGETAAEAPGGGQAVHHEAPIHTETQEAEERFRHLEL